ncbi:MAG: hypothetical protein AB1592_05070 [Pseudomonadota bacterium]
MNRRLAILGFGAVLAIVPAVASAAPCGPAVLAKVDGKVLVNRGAGFMDGTAGMPLAVGDHVMLRNGTAEILFVNGTGSALSGAKSMPITACAADASRLTSPALAAAATSTGTGTGAGLGATGGAAAAGGAAAGGLTMGAFAALGALAVGAAVVVAVDSGNGNDGATGTTADGTPVTPVNPPAPPTSP